MTVFLPCGRALRAALPALCLALLAPALPAAEYEPVLAEGDVDSRLHGVWASRGYGWMIEIPEAGPVTLWDHSDAGCSSEEVPRAELASFARLFTVVSGGKTVRIADAPENATVYTFDRREGVPEVCTRQIEPTPPNVLDQFISLMRRHYAFFEVHGADWEARSSKATRAVTAETTPGELFETMEVMLEGIADGHLRLIAEIDDEPRMVRPGRAQVGPLLDKAFEAQTRRKDLGKFQQRWYRDQRKQVRKKLLRKSFREAADGQVVWGRSGSVGYVAIFGMGGFAGEDSETIEEELAGVRSVMTRVVQELADTEALVVDVTMNGGGYDRVSLAIAAHFAAEKTVAFSKYAADAEGAEPQPFYVVPAGARYTKPITLLTSNFTVSAAEIFTMAMRALPHVTHRGEATRGALSDVLSKELLNGWTLTLSNEVYLDSEGILWEGKGIPPAEKAPIFVDGAVETSRLAAIREAIASASR